jgi:CheY-like chemotaxis protein
METVFLPFSRLKPGNKRISSDKVSLSASKQILEMHGAKVGCETEKGKGSCFHFTIDLHLPTKSEEQAVLLATEILNFEDLQHETTPLLPTKRSSLRQQQQSTLPPTTPLISKLTSTSTPRKDQLESPSAPEKSVIVSSEPEPMVNPTVLGSEPREVGGGQLRSALMVDDVRSNRRMYGRLLELLGFAVTTADDGQEALDAVHARSADNPFSVLLIDHSMVVITLYISYPAMMMMSSLCLQPNMTGMDAVQKLRGEGYTGRIIGLLGSDENLDDFYTAGVDAVVNKPVDSARLAQVMSELDIDCDSRGQQQT